MQRPDVASRFPMQHRDAHQAYLDATSGMTFGTDVSMPMCVCIKADQFFGGRCGQFGGNGEKGGGEEERWLFIEERV